MKILLNLKINGSPHFLLIFLVCVVAAGLVSGLPSTAFEPAEFILAWDANAEADLDGYEIYFREGVSGATYKFLAEIYVDELEDPDNPSVTITDLYNDLLTDLIMPVIRISELANNSTYHFALTAFDTQRKTSDFSEELCVEVIGSTVVECRSEDSGSDSGGDSDGSAENNAESDSDGSAENDAESDSSGGVSDGSTENNAESGSDGGVSDGSAENDAESGSGGSASDGSTENDAGSDSGGGVSDSSAENDAGSGGGCFIAASSFGFHGIVMLRK